MMNKNTLIPKSFDDHVYKHFEIRRQMICHEDMQINHRVTVTLSTQSLLFTAASIALYSQARYSHEHQVKLFISLMAMVGIVFGIVMFRAIRAGRREQENIKQFSERSPEPIHQRKYRHLALPEDLKDCLQATSGQTLGRGYSYSPGVPLASVLLWIIFVLGVWAEVI